MTYFLIIRQACQKIFYFLFQLASFKEVCFVFSRASNYISKNLRSSNFLRFFHLMLALQLARALLAKHSFPGKPSKIAISRAR